MNVQFTSHAIQHIQGRLSSVITYAEVQQCLSEMQPRPGNQHLLIKKLPHAVDIRDDTCIDKHVRGDKVWSLCTVSQDGIRVDTVALSF
jgi:hypothetical protein